MKFFSGGHPRKLGVTLNLNEKKTEELYRGVRNKDVSTNNFTLRKVIIV